MACESSRVGFSTSRSLSLARDWAGGAAHTGWRFLYPCHPSAASVPKVISLRLGCAAVEFAHPPSRPGEHPATAAAYRAASAWLYVQEPRDLLAPSAASPRGPRPGIHPDRDGRCRGWDGRETQRNALGLELVRHRAQGFPVGDGQPQHPARVYAKNLAKILDGSILHGIPPDLFNGWSALALRVVSPRALRIDDTLYITYAIKQGYF